MARQGFGRPVGDSGLGTSTPSPRMPGRVATGRVAVGAALAVHLTVGLAIVATAALPSADADVPARPSTRAKALPTRLVFLHVPGPGGGGGGGGDAGARPPTRMRAAGNDRRTSPGRRPVTQTIDDDAVELPAALAAVDPLASAADAQSDVGIPEGPSDVDVSAGPGSGSGTGGGIGSGVGDGIGAGVGPGVGEGAGGGVYRVGSGVVAPVVLRQVPPRYTDDAMRNGLQGTVTLTAVVGRDGRPRDIRVTRSLDPGLDEEAARAAGEWRFAPGRLGNRPVDVAVTILIDFRLH
jgi:periplasmic protein TonB